MIKDWNREFFSDEVFTFKDSIHSYKKIVIPILKVYNYFNQLGDSFYKCLPELGLKINSLSIGNKNLFYTHYFNILVMGILGSGKSSFVNKIMEEKKAFTYKYDRDIIRSNFYIHKNYPIRIIDIPGLIEEKEMVDNIKLMNKYLKDYDDIIINLMVNQIIVLIFMKIKEIKYICYYILLFIMKYMIFIQSMCLLYVKLQN
jgi:GTP-binding protein EngB required for normal cell division